MSEVKTPPTDPKVEEKVEEKAPEDSTQNSEVTTTKVEEGKAKEEEKGDVQYGDEEEKQVKIENKDNLVTGTEDEELIWINKAKLYRFRDEKWKERGNGYCKILRNKESKKIRFLLRTEKTKKLSANFYISDSPS